MVNHILWVALGALIAGDPREGREGYGTVGHRGCLGVRPGLLGLKVSVNCTGGKVQPEGSAHPCQMGPPSQVHLPAHLC